MKKRINETSVLSGRSDKDAEGKIVFIQNRELITAKQEARKAEREAKKRERDAQIQEWRANIREDAAERREKGKEGLNKLRNDLSKENLKKNGTKLAVFSAAACFLTADFLKDRIKNKDKI